MDAFDMVRLLKMRQYSLIQKLPPHLLAEYEEIESAIRHIDQLILEKGKGVQISLTPLLSRLLQDAKLQEGQKAGRVSMSERRDQLRNFLRQAGPSPRAEILATTGIPAGTLSVLLTEPEFERDSVGRWELKEG